MKLVERDDGMKYYHLEKGTKLYRGDSSKEGNKTLALGNKQTFFGFDEENVKQYGIVYEFEVKDDIFLLAIDDKETMKQIYKNAPEYIQLILRNNYGYETQIRNSDNSKDNQLVQYLCDNNYEGYAASEMRTDLNGKFHPESAICNPNKKINAGNRITDEKEKQSFIDKYKLEQLKKKSEEKRNQGKKKSRRILESQSMPESPPRGLAMPGSLQFSYDSPPRGLDMPGSPQYSYDSPPRELAMPESPQFSYDSPPSTKKTKKRGGKRKVKTRKRGFHRMSSKKKK